MEVIIRTSKKKDKKLEAIVDGSKTVGFGQKGASDYTIHRDPQRKQRYIDGHKKNEDWSKDGVKTAGFYSRWVLWNKPTLQASVDDLNSREKNITFKLK